MRLIVIILLFLCHSVAFAQEPLILSGELGKPQLDLATYTWFYEDDSGDTLPLSVVQTKPFRPFSQKRNERTSFSDRSVIVTWLTFTIQNTHPTDTLRLYHRAGMHNMITTFENGRIINRVGQSIPGSLSKAGKNHRPYRMETLLRIPPASMQTYYVRILDFQAVIIPVLSEVISPTENTDINYELAVLHYPLLSVMSLLLGCLLFMALYALYSFFLTKDIVFFYYFLYIIISS